MGRCEVTWNEYELFMYPDEERRTRATIPTDAAGDKLADAVTHPSKPYVEMSFGMGKDGFPAISMTQHGANKYCQWLSAKTGQFYRLPTEAEWEYACRAGTTTAYFFGDDASKLPEYGWFEQNSDFKYQKVGKKKPNPWGLHDMCGNVVEWVLDQYDPETYKQGAGTSLTTDPWNRATKSYPHAVRGGSWDDQENMLRSAARRGSDRVLENAGPATSQEHLVFLRRAIRRIPHRASPESSAAGRNAEVLVQRRGTGLVANLFARSNERNQTKTNTQKLMEQTPAASPAVSRRQFIRTSSLVAASAAAAVNFPAVLSAQTKKPLNAVILGIGGRGGGAGGDFLEAAKTAGVEAKIVAVADLFPEQALRGRDSFSVPEDKCFSGFDGYMKALAVPGVNYAILASPPGFRAPHFKACVEAGKHVFMEKPVAVDGPGCQVMYQAAAMAKQKNLKVAAGTQRRHQQGYIETIKRIKDGAIGDVVSLRAYWVNGGPIWHRGDKGANDLERQIRNWYHYIWLCGDHICEQHVHNLDICNWIMGGHPVRCWGMGGRQQLGDKSGEIWDNFAVEYEYEGGVRAFSYCGQIKRDWSRVSEGVHGSKGSADPSGVIQPKGGQMWRFRDKATNAYVQEHVDLINAIQNDTAIERGRTGDRQHAHRHHGPGSGLQRRRSRLGQHQGIEVRLRAGAALQRRVQDDLRRFPHAQAADAGPA